MNFNLSTGKKGHWTLVYQYIFKAVARGAVINRHSTGIVGK